MEQILGCDNQQVKRIVFLISNIKIYIRVGLPRAAVGEMTLATVDAP
jgi:hypothetical protein